MLVKREIYFDFNERAGQNYIWVNKFVLLIGFD